MPLHFAALQGHVEVLCALLACPGVDCNAPDGLGMTPLHHAAVNGQEACCAELLSRGARVDSKLSVRTLFYLVQTSRMSLSMKQLGVYMHCMERLLVA
jgi:ankyrin repeat protein